MAVLAFSTGVVWLLSIWLGVSGLRARGAFGKLKRLAAAVACAGLGVLLGTLLIVVGAYQAFSGETLLARVRASRLSPEEFELVYVPVLPPAGAGSRRHGQDAQPAPIRVRLRGNQWSLSGGIVKWHPWLTAMGLKSYQRPMRLSGQFANIERQRAHFPTVYPLASPTDWMWEWLYRADPYLPFVEAVYGSAASVYVEPGAIQEVYVTPSGYMIKRR